MKKRILLASLTLVLIAALALIIIPGLINNTAEAAPPPDSIIQDPLFYGAVLRLLGKEDGYAITADDVKDITRIDIQGDRFGNGSGKCVEDLIGIEYFTNLEHLYCADSHLTSLNILNNTKLKHLDINDNDITSLDLSNNTALELLNCVGNQLTSLDLSKNTALEFLNCGSNQLTSLDLSKNTALEFLNCGSNQLTHLDLSKNTALSRLSVRNNYLSELDITGLPLYSPPDYTGPGSQSPSNLDVRYNNMRNESAVIGFTGIWDEIWYGEYNNQEPMNPLYRFHPQNTLPIDDSIIDEALNDDEPYVVLDEDTGSIISKSSLEKIRRGGKSVKFELDNGIVIEIDPETITDDARSIDLNMDVIFVSNGTQYKKDNEHTGAQVGANSIIITPAAYGQFGFEIALTVTAQQLKDNSINANNVKLFYVDGNGSISEIDTLRVNRDGSVTVRISHASFYVLSGNTPISLEINQEPNNQEPNNLDDVPDTGESFSDGSLIWLIVIVGLTVFASAMLVSFVYSSRRKASGKQ